MTHGCASDHHAHPHTLQMHYRCQHTRALESSKWCQAHCSGAKQLIPDLATLTCCCQPGSLCCCHCCCQVLQLLLLLVLACHIAAAHPPAPAARTLHAAAPGCPGCCSGTPCSSEHSTHKQERAQQTHARQDISTTCRQVVLAI